MSEDGGNIMNVQLNDSGVPIIRQKTFAQKVKGFLLWTILILLTIAAALLVYLCVAGASEMAALTTLKKVSSHPYYTMSYDNFNYDDMLYKELPNNNEVVQYYKKKFFKSASGFFPGEKGSYVAQYVEYETDSDLRDTEKIPVKEDIYEYFQREVRPYVADAWINLPPTKIGCEISFNKYFYKPVPLRTLEENEQDILELDRQSQGFIQSLFNLM